MPGTRETAAGEEARRERPETGEYIDATRR
jgi:hypothetical protein